ncbi:class I SAM-dependent methyltransferase [Erythrobacter sp. NFXS35]|uniref:SAM-dependent methyltransferase n=1 Tax=Erythrobacter sp. NFXS35 TaxID=2818436 RepID=UPI0032DE306A
MWNPLKRIGRSVTAAPSLRDPLSQACTQAQMDEPAYAYWCAAIGEVPRTHRKQWEFCYILQALARNGMLAPGLRGLGFGVGGEPLAALLAQRGAAIVATDLDQTEAQALGWVDTDQHAASKAALNARALCEPEAFDRLVDFRVVDMNAIPADLAGQFDFCWSACALEHLGSIEQGLAFIEQSVECLVPGGVAVHTTEFNCSSDDDTLDNASTVLFRQRDFLQLAATLRARGHSIDITFDLGDQPLDQHVDVAPYSADKHLKLQIEQWVTTSFGLIVRKAGG